MNHGKILLIAMILGVNFTPGSQAAVYHEAPTPNPAVVPQLSKQTTSRLEKLILQKLKKKAGIETGQKAGEDKKMEPFSVIGGSAALIGAL